MLEKSQKQTSASTLNQHLRKPDLSILGNAIRKMSPCHWQANMFFVNVADSDFRRHTRGGFPATLRSEKSTHPIFILAAGTVGHVVCPCSSRGDKQQTRYVRAGCRLEMSAETMDRDSFLIEKYSFTLPLDVRFSRKVYFKGRVPADCIQGRGTHQ